MRNQMKFDVYRIALLNNRLRDYKRIIQTAKSNGYTCCSLLHYYRNKDVDCKFLILRHDVDSNTPATKKMFELEKSDGVKSTYYFRDSTIDLPLIADMHNAGFEVGYHYETIANLVKAGGIFTKEDIHLDEVRKCFLKEKLAFDEKICFETFTCASHGAPENVRIGVSNNVIFEDVDSLSLDVEVEAYNKNLYENYIDYHIMDGPITRNYGWSYSEKTPWDAMKKGKRAILLLVHPNHWYMSYRQYCLSWYALLSGKATFSTYREFKRIAQ